MPKNKVIWPHGANMMLGMGLLSSPTTLGYGGSRLACSDLISGVLIITLSALMLSPRQAWLQWPLAGIGLWLMSAPLVFWTESAAAYNNDTLIGALVIIFSILVPGTLIEPQSGKEIPPGWSYNPSTWSQRVPIVALALVGFFLSRYMAAYQLGHIQDIWEPFFSPGTRKILESDVSKAFPVSDAGLGALSYMVDALAGLVGGVRRWRTMPWMVVLFGLFIIPPGVVSIVLVILQPVAVGTWCTLCLLASIAMLLMVPPAIDEVIATSQLLVRNWRDGKGFWKTFWHGDTEKMGDETSPKDSPLTSQASFFQAWLSGVVIFSTPWNLLLSTLIGVGLMTAPEVLGMQGAAATNAYVVGALVVTFAIIAGAAVARTARFLNILCGAWLLVASFVLGGNTSAAMWSSIMASVLLIALSIPRGKIEEKYGGWEWFII